MVEAEAEVAADMEVEVEIANATDAEMSATFLGIALTPSVEVVAVVEMTMRPTTDKQEQFKRNIFSLGVEMSCNLQTGFFHPCVSFRISHHEFNYTVVKERSVVD
jgi:hypothetical protein